jgi:hypothetical protein
MAIKKHLNVTYGYVARSEETSWKMLHQQGRMTEISTEILFVFEDRIGF